MGLEKPAQTKKPNVNAGHRGRLRDHFVKNGADSFADHQLLELLLFYSVPRIDTNKLAHRMIQAFGSLRALLEATPNEIVKACGVSPRTARLVSLIRPIAGRLDALILEPTICLSSAVFAGEYAVSLFGLPQKERLCILYLDSSSRLLGTESLLGITLQAMPAKVAESALRLGSTAAILIRVLPGGPPEPLHGDYDIIAAIRTALHAIHTVLFDYIAISHCQYFSCADHELMRLSYTQ